uniref:Putative ribonuclease H-like domain-containing protein n=1 Tax=Tanacetum cinerariifolium TaxID=118510 RepID=A0A6L2P9K2_TANCI|nr:putative ribonuclease H-like domain-containing protein [Tanacetum cinerariifolium]
MPPKPNLVFRTTPIDVETDHSAFTIQLSPSKPTQYLSHTNRPSAPIIEDWVSDSEDEYETNNLQSVPSFVQSFEQVKAPRHSVQPVEAPILAATLEPSSLKSNSSSKRRNRKTCFMCRSVDHLIKDCDYHAKKKAQPTPRNYAYGGNNKQNDSFTHKHPPIHMVPTAVLTQSKPVSITDVRPVCAAVPKIMVTRSRHAHSIDTKSKSPIRRHITCSLSPKTSNSPPRVTTAQALVVSATKGKKGKWAWRPKCPTLDHDFRTTSASMILKRFNYNDALGRSKSVMAWVPKESNHPICGTCPVYLTLECSMVDILPLEGLKFNLFSVSQMCDKKNRVLFIDTECLVLTPDFKLPDESQVLLRVPRENNMYTVNLKNNVPSGDLTCLFAKAIIDESNLWHRRLGHINFKTINKLVKGNLVRGLPTKVFKNNNTCVACKKGKQHRASCKTKPIGSIDQPFFRLHMDLFGPTFVKSLNMKSYCLVITDDYNRFTWVFFLDTKDETSPILKTFITGLENQLSLKVKVIRSDNGTEFKNSDINQFCGLKGIKREFIIPRTPQQNGIAERKNRTLIKAARTMLADSLLPIPFWAETVNTACYVQNRVREVKGSVLYPGRLSKMELLRGKTGPLLRLLELCWQIHFYPFHFGLRQSILLAMSRIGCNAEVQVQDNVDDAAQGADTVVLGDDVQDQSIPSPTPPPQQAQDLPSTSQEALDACAALTRRVEHLEHDKVAQALEITKLKKKVKKLERAIKVNVLKLRRLKKVGTSQRIESSGDTDMEDASNQRRMIADLDRDTSVALMDDEGTKKKAEDAQVAGDEQVKRRQAEIYQIDMDHTSKIVAAVSKSVTAASATIAVVPAATITAALVRVAAAFTRKIKGVVIRDPEEESTNKIPAETKSKDKGKGIMVEEPKPVKKKQQVEMDEEYARKLHEELNKDIDWSVAIDHVKQKAKEDSYVQRYQVMKKRPQTEAQARRNMIMYLKNVARFRLDYFKGMSYDDIRPIFEAKFNSNIEFLLKSKEQIEEEENRAIESINETPAQKAAKKRKLNEEYKDLKQHLEIVPDEDNDVYTETTPLARKVPVVDYQIIQLNNKPRYKIIRADGTHQLYVSFIILLKNFDREDLESLWSIVKKRSWKLLESCGVHMRLRVEEESKMSLELLSAVKHKLMLLDSAAERRLMMLSQDKIVNDMCCC